MTQKKACVLFTPGKEAEASLAAGGLTDEGYEVVVVEVTEELIKAANGPESIIPPELEACIGGAEVCVILVDEESEAAAALGGVAGIASDGGSRVVTIGGEPQALPSELDDLIDGHLPAADSPKFLDIINGEPERITTEGQPAENRNEDKVKCQ